jgi:hypothetical protein
MTALNVRPSMGTLASEGARSMAVMVFLNIAFGEPGMKIESRIESGVVFNTVGTDTDLTDILKFIGDHYQEWHDADECWILTQMDFKSISPLVIRQFVDRTVSLSIHRAGRKAAIVVEADLGYGMMRMLQMLAEDKFKNHLAVFRSLESALEWLGVQT